MFFTPDSQTANTDSFNGKDEDFLACIAYLGHEVRNPLEVMLRTIEYLRRTPLTRDQAKSIEVFERQVAALRQLADDLFDYSCHDSHLQRSDVALFDLVSRAIETAQPQIVKRNQILDVQVPDGAALLHVDVNRMVQVLNNLLTNASKFSPAGAAIRLLCERQDEFVEIRVVDTGKGITMAELPHIFELFYSGHSVDRSLGGRGLGLAIARRFTELHSGSISVHSEGLKHGSTFVVRLPCRGE
jgi:signal transduction histidine kinase